MVVPWRGFPMSDLINRVEPLPSANPGEARCLQRCLGGVFEQRFSVDPPDVLARYAFRPATCWN
jgi:DMSO/TMAO reductase YedYZ molybdopterin-dependent catalytic subunit